MPKIWIWTSKISYLWLSDVFCQTPKKSLHPYGKGVKALPGSLTDRRGGGDIVQEIVLPHEVDVFWPHIFLQLYSPTTLLILI